MTHEKVEVTAEVKFRENFWTNCHRGKGFSASERANRKWCSGSTQETAVLDLRKQLMEHRTSFAEKYGNFQR